MLTFAELPMGSLFMFEWEQRFHYMIETNNLKEKYQIRPKETLPYILAYKKTGDNSYTGQEILLNNYPRKNIKPGKVHGNCYENAEVIKIE